MNKNFNMMRDCELMTAMVILTKMGLLKMMRLGLLMQLMFYNTAKKHSKVILKVLLQLTKEVSHKCAHT